MFFDVNYLRFDSFSFFVGDFGFESKGWGILFCSEGIVKCFRFCRDLFFI